MAFSHTITRSFASGSGTLTSSTTYNGNIEVDISESCPASTTTEIDVAITVANLQSLYMKSDQIVVIKVNDTTSPTKTFTLPANEAYIWPNGGDTNPLGASNVTKIYVIVTTGPAAFEMRSLQT